MNIQSTPITRAPFQLQQFFRFPVRVSLDSTVRSFWSFMWAFRVFVQKTVLGFMWHSYSLIPPQFSIFMDYVFLRVIIF